MALPTIHLNGTSQDALVEQRTAVLAPLREARRLLAEMAPNGRDYLGRPEAWTAAVAAHDERAAKLEALISEVEEEAFQISVL